jgi:hypothetical protein
LGKKGMEVHEVQAMWQQIGNQRQGGECVFSSQLGGFAGGGAEKTPAGDYSINTPRLVSLAPFKFVLAVGNGKTFTKLRSG